MVRIDFANKNSEKIIIIPEPKDHIEQIIAFSTFLLATIIFSFYLSVRVSKFPIYMIIWALVFLIGLLYFVFPTSNIVFDFSQNFWFSHRKAFFIPFARNSGKISDIDVFVVIDEAKPILKSKKKKLQFHIDKTQYTSGLELWENIGSENGLYDNDEKNIQDEQRTDIGLAAIISGTALSVPGVVLNRIGNTKRNNYERRIIQISGSGNSFDRYQVQLSFKF